MNKKRLSGKALLSLVLFDCYVIRLFDKLVVE